MKLVLFVTYEGDYECGDNTDVLPIEYADKESALNDLNTMLNEHRQLQQVYNQKHAEWHDKRPRLPNTRPYNGSNPRTLAKRTKQEAQGNKVSEKLKADFAAWMALQPSMPPPKFTFAGYEFWVHGLQDAYVLTLDEWYATK